MSLVDRVVNLIKRYTFDGNRVFETVNVLGCVIRARLVRQSIMMGRTASPCDH